MIGYGAIVLLVVLCAISSVSLVLRNGSFDAGEVIITVSLPGALVSAVIGAVCGVGDGRAGGERDGILTGLPRGTIYGARAAACACLVAGVVLLSLVVAAVGVVAAVSLGGHLNSASIGAPIGQVAALTLSSAAMAFGIGASVRSLPLALVSVVLIVLVADVALSFAGAWTAWIRFSAVQGGVLGESRVLPAVTSGLVWIAVPCVGGYLRTRTVEA
ncbi:hypothetical protein [Curtobacterium sp. YR515]|uniref:hypothetical protein n=1 Tax=Curtobacterium sp. YR515 TaxID=1855316 RepID=UPI000B81306B|nr:hypothetical protein [Curtobacterium sp. YR515]